MLLPFVLACFSGGLLLILSGLCHLSVLVKHGTGDLGVVTSLVSRSQPALLALAALQACTDKNALVGGRGRWEMSAASLSLSSCPHLYSDEIFGFLQKSAIM